MYNKVDTNLNFMEREKNVEQFWRDNDIFKKSMEQRKQVRPTHSMTDLRLQTASRISDIWKPVLSRT